MAIEYHSEDRVRKAQQKADKTGSLFQPTTHSTPLPNRKPVSNVYSKPPLPSNEEVAAAERAWKGEEKLEKSESVLGKVVKRKDTGDGIAYGYESGGSVWLSKADPLAGEGLKAMYVP